MFWAGFGGTDRAQTARDSNGPASMAEREGRAGGGTASGETASGGRCGLATTHLDSLASSIEDPGRNPAAFYCFVPIYYDLRQPILAPGIVAIGTAVANSCRALCRINPHGLLGLFHVIISFGARREENLLGNRWVHLWIQES